MKRMFNITARTLTLVLALSLLFSSSGLAQIDPAAWYGDGSATEYYIGAGAELAYLADLVNSGADLFTGKTITLSADIDLYDIDAELEKYMMYPSSSFRSPIPYDGKGWVPIAGPYAAGSFRGTFDGNGYVVKNLYINRPDDNYQGLFGQLGNGIKNLGVIDINVTGKNYVGGIAGNAGGAIENCFTMGKVEGIATGVYSDGEYIGGIAGRMTGGISNSYSTADVTGRSIAGGISGTFQDSNPATNTTSEYLYSTGTVIGNFPDRSGTAEGSNGGIFAFVQYANNTLQNAVALNEAIVSGNTRMDFHKRIANIDTTNLSTIKLLDNYAWDGMVFRSLDGLIVNGFAEDATDSEDGKGVSADQIYDGTVWGTDYANFPTDIWIIEPGKLPILKIFETRNAARSGVSLQSSEFPVHVMEQVTELIEQTGLGVRYNDGAVVVKKAERLAVATLWFTVNSGTPQFTGLNNFSVLDSAVDGNRYRVTLGYLVAGGAGFTSDNAGLLTISGATGVNLVNARFSGYDANGNAGDISYYVEKDNSGGDIIPPVDPPIVDPIAKYDLNNDGVVDQLDLAIALSFFTVNGGDANWNSAKIADFNNDGRVDIEDFILLLNHMVW